MVRSCTWVSVMMSYQPRPGAPGLRHVTISFYGILGGKRE
jgi:hypothetical protein